jgi:hypothetical protein
MCIAVELQSAHRFIALSARNRTRGTAYAKPAAVLQVKAIGDLDSGRWLNNNRKTPTPVGLFPVLHDPIDLILNQPDGRRPTYRRHSGFASAVAKPEFPPPPTAIRQLNDGIFDAFMFHRICRATKIAKARGGLLAPDVITK